MIRSMTGYGRASRTVRGYRLHVELKAVNHRYAEIAVRLPREWLSLENEVKREIRRVVRRGSVEAFLSIEREGGRAKTVEIDWTVADSVLKAAKQLQERFGLSDTLTLQQLMSFPELLVFREAEQEEPLAEPLIECVREAAAMLAQMRETEGGHMSRYMTERLGRLEGCRLELVSLAPAAAAEQAAKLRGRLGELLGGAAIGESDPRLMTEIAILADRSDIGEELSRLESHIGQCRKLFGADEAVGRKIDFLLQEMNREVNTIASKSHAPDIVGRVVEMKAELEKMREQAQNVE